MTLTQRLQQSDVVNLPDWRAAEILNQPDSSFPPIISIKSTPVGAGTVLVLLGPIGGANLMDTLTSIATNEQNPYHRAVFWALKIMDRAELDLGDEATRSVIDALAAAGAMTAQQATTLKGYAETARFPSWAEFNNIDVTARTVGLARGAQ